MVDILRDGVVWLHQFRRQNLVQPVVYHRNDLSFPLDATLGLEGTDANNDLAAAIFNIRRLDFIFDVKEFRATGMGEPARFDNIVWKTEGEQITFEVVGDGNEPPFRFVSRYRLAWRVHTVRKETVLL